MKINSIISDPTEGTFKLVYRDMESENELGDRTVSHVHAYCFYQDKLVIVYTDSKGCWAPPGGGVEERESARDAVRREVAEETNMNVLKHRFIGYQDIFEPNKIVTQTRSVCLVEPFGPFVSDPDGDITEIKLIEPKEYKSYFDWGEVGDHIFQRALQLKTLMEGEKYYTKHRV